MTRPTDHFHMNLRAEETLWQRIGTDATIAIVTLAWVGFVAVVVVMRFHGMDLEPLLAGGL